MKVKTLFISLVLCAFACAASAQTDAETGTPKDIQIEDVTAVNLGDGRILFRAAADDKPLAGTFRLIDGYHSAYIAADFADGLFNGKYEEYDNNRLVASGTYKEGRKNGIFKEYYSDGKVKSETPLADGKLDGVVKSYYTDGSVEKETEYKAGLQDGIERTYEFGETDPKIDNHYANGVQEGPQSTHFTSNVGDYFEQSNYTGGKLDGDYTQTWEDGGGIKISGQYVAGLKEGVWKENDRDGLPKSEQTYKAGKLDGPSKTFFTNGSVETVTNYAADKKNGLQQTYSYETGKLVSECNYTANRQEGAYKIWFDDGTLREEGQYERGNAIFRKEYYDNGKLHRIQQRPSGSGAWETTESYDMKGKKQEL